MIDLTNKHVSAHTGSVINLRDSESGWLVGTVGGASIHLDPMTSIHVAGRYLDGKVVDDYFLVPQSICLKGALPIMEYLVDKYGIRP